MIITPLECLCWTCSFGCNFGEKPKYEENVQKKEIALKEESAQKVKRVQKDGQHAIRR
jgi:hypothetical protein